MTDTQRGVATGMGAGLAVALLTLGAAVALGPLAEASAWVRLQGLGLSLLAPAASLAFAVARLAAHRFFTPQDIDGGGLVQGTHRAQLLQALLQNTLEQLVLALAAYAACVALLPPRALVAVPVASALFLAGRLLFFRGYARGAAHRAFGFALTFYPSLLLLAAAIVSSAIQAASG